MGKVASKQQKHKRKFNDRFNSINNSETKMKVDLKKLVLDSVDLKKLSFALLDEVLEPALKEAVAKSSTPIDDAVFNLLYPVLEAEVKKLIDAEIEKLKV